MLKTGDKVGRFVIESVLGEGGMGVVYKASDPQLGRPVAVKVLASSGSEEDAARVQREARVIAALDHPNAINVFESGVVDDEPYIVMEFVPGDTLRPHIGDAKTPVARRIRWLLDVARALAAAHRAGIVHRDVKPENVMVRPDGRVKVLDFGIARLSAAPVDPSAATARAAVATVTTKGGIVGTPMYMAPEQVRGKAADGRTDQFSWAVVAYELLEGVLPWEANDALGIVAAMMSEPPRPMQATGVPEGARTVVMRALSRTPAERFGSMDDVIALLEGYTEGGEAAPEGGNPAREKPKGPITDGKYSTQDLGQAIALALERKAKMEAQGGKYAYDDLTAAAREVGVEEHELRAALASLQPVVEPPAEEVALERKRSKEKLQRHAAMWAVFSVFFFLFDMLTSGGHWWFIVALSWGVGVAAQAVAYFFPVTRTPEEKVREQYVREKKLEKFERFKAEERVRTKEKSEERARRKMRIAEAPRATEAENEAALEALAEEEAEAEAERGRKRRRGKR